MHAIFSLTPPPLPNSKVFKFRFLVLLLSFAPPPPPLEFRLGAPLYHLSFKKIIKNMALMINLGQLELQQQIIDKQHKQLENPYETYVNFRFVGSQKKVTRKQVMYGRLLL